MAFPDSFLQELSERSDIVDVVSGYVRLGKRSGANLFGLCPFHSEKTPSFAVNPEKQIYHCFGCGKGGSVFNFIMEMEHLSFRDAVAFLARRAGMELPEEQQDETARIRQRLYALNREAARWFYDRLVSPAGQPGRAYLTKRGISPPIARSFGLGYAPDAWGELLETLTGRGYSTAELLQAGLIKSGRGGGHYDVFRNRLMFPVIDVRGNVVAFSGRLLDGEGPKYLNSPETPVFSKSRNLFGLNLAKKSKSGYILLVEGNIDVVSLHQAGFDSAVASLGTSLTPEQARLLTRYTSEVILAYDADAAGQKASSRAIGILERLDLKVRVLTIPGAKDPDEFLKTRGADAFRALLDKSEDRMDYRLRAITEKYDRETDEGRVAFVREATGMVAGLPSPVEREIYAARVAELAGVRAETVLQEAERLRKRRTVQARRDYERQTLQPVRQAQPEPRSIRYENPRSAVAEEGLIRLLYLDPGLFSGMEEPPPELFSSPVLERLFRQIKRQADAGSVISLAALGEQFTSDEMSLLTGILQEPADLQNGKKAIADYITTMRREAAKRTAGQSYAERAREIAAEKRKNTGYTNGR